MDKSIIWDLVPCYFEISWRNEDPGILLRIHGDFFKTFPSIPEDAPIVQDYMKTFRFSGFSGDMKKDFGFNESPIEYLGPKNDFFEYLAKIPNLRIPVEEPCKMCNGIKGDEPCSLCGGTGKDHMINWKKIRALSAGLNVFFQLSSLLKKPTSSKLPQLMTFDLYVGTDSSHGGSIGGEIGALLGKWLSDISRGSKSDVSLPIVEAATRRAFEHMFGPSRYNTLDYRAYVRSGGLFLSCPGDRCDVEPALGFSRDSGWGYQFGCHNVDTAAQQIALLSGLTAFCDFAREKTRPV